MIFVIMVAARSFHSRQVDGGLGRVILNVGEMLRVVEATVIAQWPIVQEDRIERRREKREKGDDNVITTAQGEDERSATFVYIRQPRTLRKQF